MKSVYIDKDELLKFVNSDNTVKSGVSYEWEGEDVVHLRLAPVRHAFGKCGRCEWTKIGVTSKEREVFYISIDDASTIPSVEYLDSRGNAVSCSVGYIPSQDEMYSRAKGILEVDILSEKRVMIVGLGSFGSQIAIELAKAGVGNFALFDFDRVELHNLARHTATINDLGRLKTDVLKDAILGKNKLANVELYPVDINKHKDIMDMEVSKSDLIICATDNNPSRFVLTDSLLKYGKVGIFGRAVTRAEGGDVFRHRPDGPCYHCLVGSAAHAMASEEITSRDQLPAYVSEVDANAAIQVGLSSDIEPICNLMIKLSLMELSRGEQSGIEALESELTYDYYMWANRRERRHANWAPFNASPKAPTILRWYGARINKVDDCPLCSKVIALDLGDGLPIEILNDDLEGISLE